MSVGKRIKIVRKQKKLNQRNFAQILGLSQAHISNIECDKDNPSDKLLKEICINFGISFDWLKHDKGEMYSKDVNLDYSGTLLEIKKLLTIDEEVSRLNINELLVQTVEMIQVIEQFDNKEYYYNHIHNIMGIMYDLLKLIVQPQFHSQTVEKENMELLNKKHHDVCKQLEHLLSIMMLL